MAQVDIVGVWYLGCTLPNDFGNALYAAMASVVRAVGALKLSVNGLNQPTEILLAASPADPVYTLTSATTEKIASTTISAPSNRNWVRAESSMPRQAIQVISRIHTEPATISANLL